MAIVELAVADDEEGLCDDERALGGYAIGIPWFRVVGLKRENC